MSRRKELTGRKEGNNRKEGRKEITGRKEGKNRKEGNDKITMKITTR